MMNHYPPNRMINVLNCLLFPSYTFFPRNHVCRKKQKKTTTTALCSALLWPSQVPFQWDLMSSSYWHGNLVSVLRAIKSFSVFSPLLLGKGEKKRFSCLILRMNFVCSPFWLDFYHNVDSYFGTECLWETSGEFVVVRFLLVRSE